jgi:hypothetical protein
MAFVTAYNFAKHREALRWRTLFQAICAAWTKHPAIFKVNPHHLIPGAEQLTVLIQHGPAARLAGVA